MGGIFPESFWPLALAHGFALLCPGPDFMLIVSHGMRHKLRGSAFICPGIAFGNAVYIALAIAGWAGLGAEQSFQRPLEIIGALYLAWLGVRIFRAAAPLALDGADGRPDGENAGTGAETGGAGTGGGSRDGGGGGGILSAPAQFVMGLGSAVLNPKNMIFYLGIMTALLENDATMSQRIAAGVWMCGVVLLWDLVVASAISRSAVRKFLWRWIPFIEKVCGAFLVFAAASVIFGW